MQSRQWDPALAEGVRAGPRWAGRPVLEEERSENEVSDNRRGAHTYSKALCLSIERYKSEGKSICCFHRTSRSWCFVCMTLYAGVRALTYVFVHSHMTGSALTSPLCSTLIIFITAIWMCRAHDECATQVWLAPNRILGYGSRRQQGPERQTTPHASVSHTPCTSHTNKTHMTVAEMTFPSHLVCSSLYFSQSHAQNFSPDRYTVWWCSRLETIIPAERT